jgi:hypothetical protein
MPFDGASFALRAPDPLKSAIAASGLEPIDPRLLDRHKAEQIRRHPPSWAYRHLQAIEFAQVAALVVGVVSFVALFSADRLAWGSAAGLIAFGLGIVPMLFPIRGPAQWRERPAGDLQEVPAAIRECARILQHQVPETRFFLGELFQDRIRLDPYLIAERGGTRAVLGIWEDDEVIACA